MSEELPSPTLRSHTWLPSLVWVVPIVAALVGLSLLINAWRTTGPRITILFQTAEGLEVGKTLVKHRNVTIGHVTAITLSRDRNAVLVAVQLVKDAQDTAVADTKFWVVRPRFGVGWVSGLDTLLTGPFISAEPGVSKSTGVQFTGLETPPPLSHPPLGRRVELLAQDLGSVSLGAPVYYRRLQVGRVIDAKLDNDGAGARIVLFIDAPNDRFVTPATRFWNASGIDVTMSADGMNVKAQSVLSVLAGGIAFAPGPTTAEDPNAASDTQFTLFKDEPTAMASPDGEPRMVRMRFQESLRDLALGAPVDFVGVNIGSVIAIDLEYEPSTQRFPVIVTARIYPRRMGRAEEKIVQQGNTESDDKVARFVGQLVAKGLRVQPRQASLLSGHLYLALDFVPGAGKVAYNPASRPLEIPTIRGSIDELQLRLASVVSKIDQLPLDHIAHEIDSDLEALHGAIDSVNSQVLPSANATLMAARSTLGSIDRTLADDSPWRESLEQTLGELRRTLRSARSLTDYLDRHPEALIRGRRPDKSTTAVSEAHVEPSP